MMKLNAGKTTKDEVSILVDPKEIELGRNGRRKPHSDADIARRLASYEQHGQLEAVECNRREKDKKLVLTYGFLRHAAALAYNEKHPDKPMKLKVRVVITNEQDAFLRNIVENYEHKSTSAVDDAFNQKYLREELGWKDVDIAKQYGVHKSVVSRLKKLVTLRESILDMIDDRTVPFSIACDLASFSEKDQDEILASLKEEDEKPLESRVSYHAKPEEKPEEKPAAKPEGDGEEIPFDSKPEDKGEEKPEEKPAESSHEGNGKATKPKKVKKKTKGQKLTEATRKKKIESGEGKGRSIKSLKEFWEGFDGPGEDANVRTFAGYMLDHINGKITDILFEKKVVALIKKAEIEAK